MNIGGHNVPRVIADFSDETTISPASLSGCGYKYSVRLDKWNLSDQACDYIYAGDNIIDFEIPGTLGIIYNYETWKLIENGQLIIDNEKSKENFYPLFNFN